MSRRLAQILPALGAVAILATSATASAQSAVEPTWRRRTVKQTPSPLGNFTFEARFGGYYPQVDEELGGAATPFADVFGKGPQFYFGLEVDWLPIVIPYIGKLGPGFGWGYTTMNGKAEVEPVAGDTTTAATETAISTGLSIHAMHASVVLRIDEISKRIVVPIVPYAKLGFGMGLWSAGVAGTGSKVGTDCTATTPKDCVTGDGLSIGPHVGLGGMLGLNWLDRRSGSMARETTGVDQAYIFGEWMFDKLDSGVGKDAMHVGTSSWVLGIALDL